MEQAKTTELTATEATRHEILNHAQDLFTYYGFNKTNIGPMLTQENFKVAICVY